MSEGNNGSMDLRKAMQIQTVQSYSRRQGKILQYNYMRMHERQCPEESVKRYGVARACALNVRSGRR